MFILVHVVYRIHVIVEDNETDVAVQKMNNCGNRWGQDASK